MRILARGKTQCAIILAMIAHISGKLTEKFDNSVIVDVHGVGYEIAITSVDAENAHLGDEVKFYTYHAVRDNAEELYGFSTLAAKRLFQLLISVQGVGPRAAMAILSLAAPEEVRNAIANTDSAFVAKASGVGKKTAERVIVDLRDKVGAPSHYGATDATGFTAPTVADDEALDALIALGFPLKEATAALEKVDPTLSVEERIRLALKQ